MKKNILLIAGIAGMFIGNSSLDAQAELSIRLGDIRIDAGERPTFVIDTRPDFIYLEDQGFSVSIDSPYDIISYNDLYYLYRDGGWYRSSDYRGPWIVVHEYELPYKIRRHRWQDIRRYRDVEYRKHDRSYWEERGRRERDRERLMDKGPRVNPDQRRDDNRGNNRDQRNDDNRLFDGNNRVRDNKKTPDQPKSDNVMRVPDQRRDDNRGNNRDQRNDGNRSVDLNNRGNDTRKVPDQPKSSNVMKVPDQPKKDTNIQKAPDQTKKDDGKNSSGQHKKDDQGSNPNPPK